MLGSDWIPSHWSLGLLKRRIVDTWSLSFLPSGLQAVALLAVSVCIWSLSTVGKPYLAFAYNCFLKPFLTKKANGVGSDEHQSRLESFYEGQADIYDVTRAR